MNATIAPSGAERVSLMGATFWGVTEAEVVDHVIDSAREQNGSWVITANLDHLRRYVREPAPRRLMNEASLVCADGAPLVWASRLQGGVALPERVAGSSMVWSVCQKAAEQDVPLFLLGGEPGVAGAAERVLVQRYPGLRVVGTLCPEIGFERSPETLQAIERAVTEANPGVVLVALGFPKQDLLIERLRTVYPAASYIGVGISLGFIAGQVKRAPVVLQRAGLEWVHRLVQEPARLGRRYLLEGIPFAVRLFASCAKNRLRNSTRSRTPNA